METQMSLGQSTNFWLTMPLTLPERLGRYPLLCVSQLILPPSFSLLLTLHTPTPTLLPPTALWTPLLPIPELPREKPLRLTSQHLPNDPRPMRGQSSNAAVEDLGRPDRDLWPVVLPEGGDAGAVDVLCKATVEDCGGALEELVGGKGEGIAEEWKGGVMCVEVRNGRAYHRTCLRRGVETQVAEGLQCFGPKELVLAFRIGQDLGAVVDGCNFACGESHG